VPSRNGLQRGALDLEGSWAPSRRWEVFATLSAMAFRSLLVGAQNQSPLLGGRNVGDLTLGSATVGATWVPVSLPRGRFDGGLFLRFLLPTSLEVKGVHAWGVQPGLTFRGVATSWLAWFGGASFRVGQSWGSITDPFLGTRSADATQTGASASLGLVLVPAPWVRIVAQCSMNLPFGRGTDQLSPGAAVRFVDGPLAAEIGGTVPLLGQVRTLGTLARVSWRLGR
jgi:hypothetical protein